MKFKQRKERYAQESASDRTNKGIIIGKWTIENVASTLLKKALDEYSAEKRITLE